MHQNNSLWQQILPLFTAVPVGGAETWTKSLTCSRDWILLAKRKKTLPAKQAEFVKVLEQIQKRLDEKKTLALPSCTWLVDIYSTFQGASLHCHYTILLHGLSWVDNTIGTNVLAVILCAAHDLGTVILNWKEILEEGEILHSKCHDLSWSRSISIHPRSQITVNWTLTQVIRLKHMPLWMKAEVVFIPWQWRGFFLVFILQGKIWFVPSIF